MCVLLMISFFTYDFRETAYLDCNVDEAPPCSPKNVISKVKHPKRS